VNVDILVLEEIRIHAQLLRVGADEAQRRRHRFLHDVAQLAGQREAFPAFHGRGFDKKHVAAHRRPGQSDRDAGLGDARVDVRRHAHRPQVFVDIFFRHGLGGDAAFGDLRRHAAAGVGDFPLQVAHARLPRVAGDDGGKRLGRQPKLRRSKAVFRKLTRNQVLLGDLHFFFLGVARELDHLQPIQERRRNRIEHIGRRDENHLRQIERHIQVMIGKRIVLLRIQHLEQRRGRIAAEITAELVDLVEHEHGVVGLRAPQALNDAARQSADVGPAMAADFRLVAHAAQRNAGELAPQRPPDGMPQRRLARARRPHKAEDRPLGIRLELAHGQILDDALLGFRKPVVVLIQNAARLGDIQAVGRGVVPGQRGHPVEIGGRDGVFRGRRIHAA